MVVIPAHAGIRGPRHRRVPSFGLPRAQRVEALDSRLRGRLSSIGKAAVRSSAPMLAERMFTAFLQRHDGALRDIVRWARGECTVDDVRNQAWLEAFELGEQLARPLDLEAGDAALLLQRLRRHFDRAQRDARRERSLDRPLGGHPDGPTYADILPGDDGEHPLSLLEALETPESEVRPRNPYQSEVAAWGCLVARLGRTSAIAEFLLISPSWCRICRRRASERIVGQWPLPHGLRVEDDDHENALRPWRRFKLPPRPRAARDQLPLDYWSRPAQPMLGQMWLL